MPTVKGLKTLIKQLVEVCIQEDLIAICNDGFLMQCKLHDQVQSPRERAWEKFSVYRLQMTRQRAKRSAHP